MSIAIGIMLTVIISCSNNDDSGPAPEAYTKVELFMGTGLAGLGELGKNPLQTPLYLPHDLTIGPDGLQYILDWNNHRILVVDNNEVGLVIGNGELGDASDGVAKEISLNHPTNVSFNPQGNLILSAWHNSKVMSLDLNSGYIEAIVGNGQRSYGGDGAMAIDAIVDLPNSTAFDANGRMFISDQGNNRIRVVNTNGIIETYVGNGDMGFGGDGHPAAIGWGHGTPVWLHHRLGVHRAAHRGRARVARRAGTHGGCDGHRRDAGRPARSLSGCRGRGRGGHGLAAHHALAPRL